MASGSLGLTSKEQLGKSNKVSSHSKDLTYKQTGKKTIIVGMALEYEGELDANGNACGHGVAKRTEPTPIEIEGTWLNDMKHGISKFL